MVDGTNTDNNLHAVDSRIPTLLFNKIQYSNHNLIHKTLFVKGVKRLIWCDDRRPHYKLRLATKSDKIFN